MPLAPMALPACRRVAMRVLIKGAGVAGLTVAHALSARRCWMSTVAETARRASAAPHPGLPAACWRPGASGKVPTEAVLTLRPRLPPTGGRPPCPGARASQRHARRRAAARQRRAHSASQPAPPVATGSMAEDIAALEPALAGRFRKALFFPRGSPSRSPTCATAASDKLRATRGVRFQFEQRRISTTGFDLIVDCTGRSADRRGGGLRGVRGEMLYLETIGGERSSRPVRLLHPRIPLYIVPRGDGLFHGRRDDDRERRSPGRSRARSLMELLNAAYALHPAFAEARRRSRPAPACARPLPTTCRASGPAEEHITRQRLLPPRLSACAVHGAETLQARVATCAKTGQTSA